MEMSGDEGITPMPCNTNAYSNWMQLDGHPTMPHVRAGWHDARIHF